MLVWIDETGDQRNNVRKLGYSLKGIPIPVMSLEGIQDLEIIAGSVHVFSKVKSTYVQ